MASQFDQLIAARGYSNRSEAVRDLIRGAIEGDRQRTLQQEIAEVDPGAVGDFHGQERVRQGARDVAAQLLEFDFGTDSLIKSGVALDRLIGIDDTV